MVGIVALKALRHTSKNISSGKFDPLSIINPINTGDKAEEKKC
mgnify:CR=1 FL=1